MKSNKVAKLKVTKLAYSRAEAAAASSLSLRKVQDLINRGLLHSRKIDGRVLIPAKALRELIEGEARNEESSA